MKNLNAALLKELFFLKTDLESFFRSQADKICHKIKGDNTLIPKLVDFMIEELAIFLDRYAQPREFKVPIPSPSMSENPNDKDDNDSDNEEENDNISEEINKVI